MKPTEASELERGKHFLPVPTEGGVGHRVQHTSALSQEGSCPLFAISPKPHGDAHCPLRWPTAWQALGSGWKVKRAGQGRAWTNPDKAKNVRDGRDPGGNAAHPPHCPGKGPKAGSQGTMDRANAGSLYSLSLGLTQSHPRVDLPQTLRLSEPSGLCSSSCL